MSSDTFLKKYTKYWPPKLYVICCPPPREALWGKLCQSALKNKSDFSFHFYFGHRSCCYVCFVARQQPATKNMYVTVSNTPQWKRNIHARLMAPRWIWPGSLSDNKSVYFYSMKGTPTQAGLQTDRWPVSERSVHLQHTYKKNDMSNRMFPVKQKDINLCEYCTVGLMLVTCISTKKQLLRC